MARVIPSWLKRVAARVPALLLGIAFLGTAASPLGIWSSHLERMSHFRFGWERRVHPDRMGSDHHPVIAVLVPARGG